MPPFLTEEMRRALVQSGNKPLDVEDPQTKAKYVLISKIEYDQILAALSAGEATIAETYALQSDVARAQGWDDPVMDDYNDYDQRKKTA